MSDITVTGFPELREKIKELAKDQDKKKEILLILRQVARPTLQAAKVFVPVQRSYSNVKSKRSVIGGSLKQSLGLISSKSKNPTIYVGPRVFKKKGERAKDGRNTFGDGWYGAIVDQGHRIYNNSKLKGQVTRKGRKRTSNERVTRKRVGIVKSYVPGQFFMKRANDATKGTVTADAEKSVAAFIQRRINKLSN